MSSTALSAHFLPSRYATLEEHRQAEEITRRACVRMDLTTCPHCVCSRARAKATHERASAAIGHGKRAKCEDEV